MLGNNLYNGHIKIPLTKSSIDFSYEYFILKLNDELNKPKQRIKKS